MESIPYRGEDRWVIQRWRSIAFLSVFGEKGLRKIFKIKRKISFPGIALYMTMLAFNLLGDGLRDAFDPKMKNR